MDNSKEKKSPGLLFAPKKGENFWDFLDPISALQHPGQVKYDKRYKRIGNAKRRQP